jgi:predicted N-acetyltransferase YhbS
MLIVEQANEQARSEALAVTMAAYQEYEQGTSPEFWQKYSENIRQSVLKNVATVLVARDNGVVKGSVLLCDPSETLRKDGLPEMRLLAVPPEFRNQGIANVLIEECERRAVPSGGLTLHTTQIMKTAKAMYERRGYVRYPEIDFEPVPGFIVWGYRKLFSK